MNVSSVDLNLLVAFRALLEEQHVTRAARRVGLTQSAMSNALARLRSLFNDPLLTRVGRDGMVPTTRALSLNEPIRQALSIIESTLGSSPVFDPSTLEMEFRVATNDHIQTLLLAKTMRLLSRIAPRVRLTLRLAERRTSENDLLRGQLDLVLAYDPGSEAQPHFRKQQLKKDHFVCIARRSHPEIRERLTLQKFAKLQHLVVSAGGDGPSSVDLALSKLGRSRHVALKVPQYLMVPALVAETDLIAMVPFAIARLFEKSKELRLLKPPVQLAPMIIAQHWHERTDQEPAHVWLRNLFEHSASETVRDETRAPRS